jgi:hypothetical protein
MTWKLQKKHSGRDTLQVSHAVPEEMNTSPKTMSDTVFSEGHHTASFKGRQLPSVSTKNNPEVFGDGEGIIKNEFFLIAQFITLHLL